MNKTEFYTPTRAEYRSAENKMTPEQRKMSDKRANEFKERPHFVERGQIWSITNSKGEDLGDVVVQSCMGGDEDDHEFEKENPAIQFLPITKDLENTWESSLLITGEESPLEEDFAINTLITGRVFAKHLKEYKGDLGKELTDRMMFMLIKTICGCETEEERKRFSEIKKGKTIEDRNDTRLKKIWLEIDKIKNISSEYDRAYFENVEGIDPDEDMEIEYGPSDIENCDPRLDEGNLVELEIEKMNNQFHEEYIKSKN